MVLVKGDQEEVNINSEMTVRRRKAKEAAGRDDECRNRGVSSQVQPCLVGWPA